MYLLASESRGQIIEIEHGKITNELEVPHWTSDKKENFKKVTIDQYVYKKYKRIT